MVFTVFHGVSLSSVTLRNTEHFATCSLMGLHGFSIVLPYHHKKCWEKQKWVVLVFPFLVCFLLEFHIRSLFQPSIGQRLYTLAEHYCVQEGNIDKAVLNQRPRFFSLGCFKYVQIPSSRLDLLWSALFSHCNSWNECPSTYFIQKTDGPTLRWKDTPRSVFDPAIQQLAKIWMVQK